MLTGASDALGGRNSLYTIGNLDFLPKVYRVMHPQAEQLALGHRCPNCAGKNIHFVIYETDNEVTFDCDCGYFDDVPLTDLKEFGFYPESFDNSSQNLVTTLTVAENDMNILFYDCEIIKCIPSRDYNDPKYHYCDGWEDFQNMGISVIGAYASWLDSYFTLTQYQLKKFNELVMESDEIVGFNSISFDDNLIRANGMDVETSYDLLCEVRIAAGMPPFFVKGVTRGGYSLGALAEANFGTGKTGSGELAPQLWQDGEYQKVIDYCLNDVKLLVSLYERRKSLKDPTDGSLLECRD